MATFRRPRWRDPRLGVGILLVALSVALGGWVFAKADQTHPVYVAGETIAVGDTLASAQLKVVEINLGGTHDRYLDPGDLAGPYGEAAEHVFHQSIPSGELIPLSALGAAGELGFRPVSIVVTNPAPLAVGDVVDLWVVPRDIAGRDAPDPQRVSTGLHVRGVDTDDSLFGSGASYVVQVLVPEGEVGNVLGAVGASGHVTLVPHLSR